MFESRELGVASRIVRYEGGFLGFLVFLVSGDDDVGNGTVCGGFVCGLCGLCYVMLCTRRRLLLLFFLFPFFSSFFLPPF